MHRGRSAYHTIVASSIFHIGSTLFTHTSDAFKEYVWHRYKTQPRRTQCHSKGCLLHRHDARDINIYTYIYHSRCTREHTYTKKVNAMHVLCTKICQLTERFPQSQFSILSRQYSGGNINTPYCTIRQTEHRPRCTRPTRHNTRYSQKLDEPRQQHNGGSPPTSPTHITQAGAWHSLQNAVETTENYTNCHEGTYDESNRVIDQRDNRYAKRRSRPCIGENTQSTRALEESRG